LLTAAAAARAVAVGSDAASGTIARGEARLVVVARDAAAAAELAEVRRAVSDGLAVAWGSKAVLGALADRARSSEGIGILAVLDNRIAGAIREAVHAAESSTPPAPRQGELPERGAAPRAFRGSAEGLTASTCDRTKSADDRPSRSPYAERGA
jgi:hypothetical protein